MISRQLTLWLFAAAVSAQLVGLIVFTAVREVALTSGREVILRVEPVDPRSLLQGDYVILDYEVAELPDYRRDDAAGATIYVTLQEGPAAWSAVNYQPFVPPPNQVYLRGVVNRRGRLDFAMETYFVPEGAGKVIEKAIFEDRVTVVASVANDGDAVIKELRIDGRPFQPRSDQ